MALLKRETDAVNQPFHRGDALWCCWVMVLFTAKAEPVHRS